MYCSTADCVFQSGHFRHLCRDAFGRLIPRQLESNADTELHVLWSVAARNFPYDPATTTAIDAARKMLLKVGADPRSHALIEELLWNRAHVCKPPLGKVRETSPPKLVLTRPDGPLFNGIAVECDDCRPRDRVILSLADDGTAYCAHQYPPTKFL
jgi:hypothetical protein